MRTVITLTEALCAFPQFIQVHDGIASLVMSQSHPSTPFPIHCLPAILPCQ